MKTAKEHFSKRAKKYNHSSNWVSDKKLIKKIFELSEADKNSCVLDIATGTGLIAREFFGKVKKITGLDISPEMAKFSKDYMDEIVFAPIENMPFPDDSFDVCLCRQGLQFVELDKAIAEIFRVLKPGGITVLCHLTAYSDLDKETAFKIQQLRNPARKNFFMPEDVEMWLKRNGFKDVQTIEYPTEESVNQWIDNGAINAESMENIRNLYRNSDDTFRDIHHIRFVGDDILDTMLLTIVKAKK